MASSIEWSEVRRVLLEARTENLIQWSLEFGLQRYPERAAEWVDAGLSQVERDPASAGGILSFFNAEAAWSRAPEAAPRIRALLPGLKKMAFGEALQALVQCEREGARELVLGFLDEDDPERAKHALLALGHLPNGPEQVAMRLAEGRQVELDPSNLVHLLLQEGAWTHNSVRAALEVLASEERDSEELRNGLWTFLDAFQGERYEIANADLQDNKWADALAKVCGPLLAVENAQAVAKLLHKGKGPQAAERLLGSLPKAWLELPADRGEAALARTLLQICSAGSSTLKNCAQTHPRMLATLVAAAIARVQDEEASSGAKPNAASLMETLEALGASRANLREESAWIARCATFGAEALEPLKRMLQGDDSNRSWRAARALAGIGSEASLRYLLQPLEEERGDGEMLTQGLASAPQDVLARVDAAGLHDAVTKKDWKAAGRILERWCRPGVHGDGLAKALTACADTLFFEEDFRGAFCEFVRAHPLDGFIEKLAEAWRPGEGSLGSTLEILYALHRPRDSRWPVIQSDLSVLRDFPNRISEVMEGRAFLLRLRCRTCRAAYFYRITELVAFTLLQKREPRPPLGDCTIVTDPIKCKRCGAIDAYEWTEQAERSFLLQSIACMLPLDSEKEKEREGPGRGAIQWANNRSAVGDDLTFSETIERLQKRSAEKPAEPQWPLRLGNLYFAMRRLDLALAAYAGVLERWPEHVDAAFQRGLVLERLEKYGEALEAYTRAALALKVSEPGAETKAAELGRKLRELARKAQQEAPWEALDSIGRLLHDLAPKHRSLPHELAFPSRKDGPGLLAGNPLRERPDEDEVEEAYDDHAPKPVAPIRAEGRQPRPNDRCACGSGKKYKKCCGRVTAGGELQEGSAPMPGNEGARRVAKSLNDSLLKASHRLQTKEECQQAVRRWMGQTAEEQPVLGGEEAEVSLFAEYLVHDWRPEGGDRRTLLERFAEAETARFSTQERQQVEAWLRQRRKGWYEVEAADGAGMTEAKDCMTGETFRIYDLSLSRKSRRGDMFVFAIFPCGERLEMSGAASGVPRNLRRAFKAYLEREYASWRQSLKDPGAESAWPRFFSNQAAEITREIARLGALPPRVVLSTGEAHAYGYKVYGMTDRRAVLRGLEALPALRYQGWGKGNEVEGESYGWIHVKAAGPLPFQKPVSEEGETGQPVLVLGGKQISVEAEPEAYDPLRAAEEELAGIHLGRERMEVLALSKERLDFVCQALEAVLAGQLREQRRQQLDREYVDELWKNRGARKVSGKPLPQPPAYAQLQAAFIDEHWAKWPDLPLPALHGKTPREASRDPSLRGELEALLRDIEEADRRMPEAGHTGGKHLAKLRRELNR